MNNQATTNTIPLPFENPADNQRSIIRILARLIAVLTLLLAGSLATTYYALATIEISLPPDPSQGALLKRDVKDPSEVYTFALWHYQQLQHWAKAGHLDYKQNIDDLVPLITPAFKGFLDRDYRTRLDRGELNNRIRHLEPHGDMHYEDSRIRAIGSGTWVVMADYVVKEWYLGEEIKQIPLRYYLRVVKTPVTAKNRFGLRMDGYYDEPERLEKKEKKS